MTSQIGADDPAAESAPAAPAAQYYLTTQGMLAGVLNTLTLK